MRELLAPYEAIVLRLARRIVRHPQDAEDLAQDALLRILKSLPSYKGGGSFRAWVYRIALNVCLTRRSRHRPTEDLEETHVADSAPGPEDALLRRDFQERAIEEMRRLPPAYREAVILKVAEDLPYEEVAEILRMTPKAARAKVHRGVKRLRERLRCWLDEGAAK
jgi:RNA polymerase sigma-70 factor (ECF subfamily)